MTKATISDKKRSLTATKASVTKSTGSKARNYPSAKIVIKKQQEIIDQLCKEQTGTSAQLSKATDVINVLVEKLLNRGITTIGGNYKEFLHKSIE